MMEYNPKAVIICSVLLAGSIGFKFGTVFQVAESRILTTTEKFDSPKVEQLANQNIVDSRFDLLKNGEECIVDLYSDHSGIYHMKIVSKESPEKILVEDSSKKMRFVKLSQIVPKKD